MKQIAQYQDGRLELQEVSTPVAPPGGILVQTTHSVISVGTEKMKVEQAKMNLLQKARARPDQVKKVLETARNLGWKNALEKVRNRLETPTPLGYSASGVVIQVHPDNTRFRVGDRVACAGAECAFHAEILAIPDLLAARVPEGVASEAAAYSTLCAIALQAVRQTDPKIGERVLVMGQGLVGLLVTQILVANGCRVMAVDLSEARRSFALLMGAERVVILGREDLAASVRDWTDGFGVDAAIICTATQSNAPIEQAADALRDRGRLVDVGITKIELPWKIFYEKELDVRFSRSYGPGRYDPSYEWGGHDYPIGYVRWTEQRNLEACLHLMLEGRLRPQLLTTRRVLFGDSTTVYRDLLLGAVTDVGVVLEYNQREAKPQAALNNTADQPGMGAKRASQGQRIQSPVAVLDVIGAGNFARTMLLPHLKGRVQMGTVVNQTALSANHVRQKFSFAQALTDPAEVWRFPSSHAVLIATRHHLHAPMILSALETQRHVFVEKPLCLTLEELNRIDAAHSATSGSLQVGFNRRFAPASVELRHMLQSVAGPKTASYRVHPGKLDPQHWYANYRESGGRLIGEACHFLDFFCFLFDSDPTEVTAFTVGDVGGRLPFVDSFTAMVRFRDGSCGQLVYAADAEPSYPKETVVVSGEGLVAEIQNFQKMTVHRHHQSLVKKFQSKGHAEQMLAWASFLRGEADHPLPYWQSRRSMLLTFAVVEAIQTRSTVQLSIR